MAKASLHKPIVVVWIDHESSISDIVARMRTLPFLSDSSHVLSDSCRLVDIVVELGERVEERTTEKVLERALKQINMLDESADLILVDLSFDDEPWDQHAFKKGWQLADGLRRKQSPVPVGVYTKHKLDEIDRVRVISDRFAVMLEYLPEIVSGPGRFNADEWYSLFQKMTRAAHDEANRKPAVFSRSVGLGASVWAPGQPIHRSPSFVQAAPRLVDLALGWLPQKPSRLELTELSGGFSGSYLVLAKEPVTGQQYVVKIDEDPSKLDKELQGYRHIESTMSHRYYINLLGETKETVRLTGDWWGAFSMAFEEEARPLLSHTELRGEALASVYSDVWGKCLSRLYGKVSRKDVDITEVIPEAVKAGAKTSWNALARYHSRLDESHKSIVHGLTEFLSESSYDRAFAGSPLPAPWAEHVHGDLNCRNILVEAVPKNPYLIDFPHVGPSNCLVMDFVKAEAELIIIMMDWSSGRDCDFSRLQEWVRLTEALSSGFVVSGGSWPDKEIDGVLPAILRIRKIYEGLHLDHGDWKEAYRLYLIGTVLRYVTYPDPPVAKRFLAAVWAGQLLTARWK